MKTPRALILLIAMSIFLGCGDTLVEPIVTIDTPPAPPRIQAWSIDGLWQADEWERTNQSWVTEAAVSADSRGWHLMDGNLQVFVAGESAGHWPIEARVHQVTLANGDVEYRMKFYGPAVWWLVFRQVNDTTMHVTIASEWISPAPAPWVWRKQ